MKTFSELDCTIEHDGLRFTSGGSFIVRDSRTGRLAALLYAYEREGSSVGTWHGDRKVPARFGHSWRSAFGDTRQSVRRGKSLLFSDLSLISDMGNQAAL